MTRIRATRREWPDSLGAASWQAAQESYDSGEFELVTEVIKQFHEERASKHARQGPKAKGEQGIFLRRVAQPLNVGSMERLTRQ